MTIPTADQAVVPEDEAKHLFREYGIPATTTVLCRELSDLEAYLATTGGDRSTVLKLSLDGLTHKSTVGGVRVDVPAADVPAAFTELWALGQDLEHRFGAFRGVLVEQYVGRGVEAALGFHIDPSLGPVVMIGNGGTDIEATRNVAFAAAPLGEDDATALVDQWTALPGSAGPELTEAARTRLAELVLRLAGTGGLALQEKCASVDINPVLVRADELIAVDGVIERRPAPAGDPLAALAPSPRQGRGNLGAFIDPGSIALVGASTDPTKPGGALLQNLLDFGYLGSIYPIHPTAESIGGLPAYPSVSAVPGPVDKVVVLVGRQHVPAVVRECVKKGVPAVQVYSSGFSEYAAEAIPLEEETLQALAGSETRLMGPNCWGAYSPRARVTTNAARYAGTEPGHVAFVSQSGTHFLDVVRRSRLHALPLYGALSAGNCLDVEIDELAQHLLGQDDVHVLGLYLEGTQRARRLIETIRGTRKPVVVMRGGRTQQGGRAASSHTAALAGDDSVWAALMEQAGATLVDTMEEMVETLSAFATLPPVPGNRLAVFGTGGGVAVAAADIGSRCGLMLPDFPDGVSDELARRFGQPGTSMNNPIDVTVWDVFRDGRSVLSEVLSLIAVPEVTDSMIAYLELGAVLDLNSLDRTLGLVELIIDDLEQHTCRVPTSFVLRTGGDPDCEAILHTMQRRLRPSGIAVYSRIQEAVTAHARLAAAHS